MENFSLIEKIVIFGIPILFAITLHEVSHGYVANLLGDRTAKQLGRITLNPLKHIDLVGTILVPAILVATTGFLFGWAKPVPVNPRNLKKPKQHMAIVAAAGPISNLLMAVFWILMLKLGLQMVKNHSDPGLPLVFMSQAGIMINLILMVLNLIPIPPLDGSKVLMAFLPDKLAAAYERVSLFGLLILVLLMTMGILSKFMLPAISAVQGFLFMAFNVGS